jgi:hypothetical protein
MGYSALVSYAEKYLARAADEEPELEDFADNPANLMTAYLVELEEAGRVELKYIDGQIATVLYTEYYANVIKAQYARVDSQPDRPFPNEESISVQIPSDIVTPVDIKSDFVKWVARAEGEGPIQVLRLLFPENIHSMITCSDLLTTVVPKLSVQKIRQYLRSERNAGYMKSKLSAVFRQREVAMKDMLSSILTTPDQALKTVFTPTDFTFQFWTQMSSILIKEYSQKKDKLQEEHCYCQAAYLLGYYNVHYRGVLQKQRDKTSAFRALDNNLRHSPYTYTITEIHQFNDQRGVPLTRKYSVEDVNKYISERLQPNEESGIPDLIRIRTSENREYYLYRDFVLTVTLDRVFDARKSFRDHYVDTWSESLKLHRRLLEMTDDRKFDQDVENKLKKEYPILHALLDYDLLALAQRERELPPELVEELDQIIDRKERRLYPTPHILNLDRRRLYGDARLLLPVWQAVPILSTLVAFLKRLFMGVSEEERISRQERRTSKKARVAEATTVRYSPDGDRPQPNHNVGAVNMTGHRVGQPTSRRAQVARFKEAVRTLQEQYVPPGSTPDRTLEELAERWNPLLDPVAKSNLIEDVNSLSRDFLRRMKVSFRLIPPNQQRVEQWAERLSENDAFEKIRRKEDLKDYLKLYMLTVLGK